MKSYYLSVDRTDEFLRSIRRARRLSCGDVLRRPRAPVPGREPALPHRPATSHAGRLPQDRRRVHTEEQSRGTYHLMNKG